MARKPMVTRTIKTTNVDIMCLNVQTGEPSTVSVTLGGVYKDEKAILKAAKAIVETDVIKGVHIVNTEINEALYGMTEQQFVENAEILPPREAKTEE